MKNITLDRKIMLLGLGTLAVFLLSTASIVYLFLKMHYQPDMISIIFFVVDFIIMLFCTVSVISIRKTLKVFASKLIIATDTVSNGSSEISKGNQDLSSRTQEQAASLEETSSTISQITTTVKHTADDSYTASILVSAAVANAQEGTGLSDQVKTAMNDIITSSNKISEIINLVNEIAFQTNILAINAAIEAAKAGEQGKGFAVVAIEVRSLAQRSADAAKKIQELIIDSVDKVSSGNLLVENNAVKLNEIVENIKEVSKIIDVINTSSQEQYEAIEQINKAISEIDTVTQHNSALVEEISSASENMTAEAMEMNTLVRQNLSITNSF